MQLGPANNALTIMSFGKPFEEIFDEILTRPDPAGPHRGCIKVKGLIPDDDNLPWFIPNPVKVPTNFKITVHGAGGGGGGRQSSDGKEIITGDTVEGDDAPQVPDDKTEEQYIAQLRKLYAEDNQTYKALQRLIYDSTKKSPYSLGAIVPDKQPHRTGKVVRQGYEAGRFYEVVQMPDGREFMTYKD